METLIFTVQLYVFLIMYPFLKKIEQLNLY